MVFRDTVALAAAAALGILVAAPPATTGSSGCGTAPTLPLAANYTRISYGGGTVVLR